VSAGDIQGIDAGPVRAASAVRPRFESSGAGAAPPNPTRFKPADTAAAHSAAPSPGRPPATVPARSGVGFGFSTFLAQSLAQQADVGDPPASLIRDRIAAYRRAAPPEAPRPAAMADVILPRLSSGRSVDLVV
jgi:hypothetical protein